ncbi:M28 family peptidase [Bacillus sp. OVS6]|nr:M28 family peptidase [Bacillus sp. OVS6]
MDQLTKIPVVGITFQDGMKLLERMQKEEIKVVVKTAVQTGIKRVSLPIASIPGKADQYILVSGHYDSWHKGATDNAGGNALLLELARIFSNKKGGLTRGIKLAWWPGHSNGRYAGSTWYCDHFWHEINEKCMAHINVDFPGTMGESMSFQGQAPSRMKGYQKALSLILQVKSQIIPHTSLAGQTNPFGGRMSRFIFSLSMNRLKRIKSIILLAVIGGGIQRKICMTK